MNEQERRKVVAKVSQAVEDLGQLQKLVSISIDEEDMLTAYGALATIRRRSCDAEWDVSTLLSNDS